MARHGASAEHRPVASEDGLDRFEEVARHHRLREVCTYAELPAPSSVAPLAARCQKHESKLVPNVCPDLRRELEAIHLRHVEVEQRELERGTPQASLTKGR